MADPFSTAAGAVGVISLGLTVCQGLLAYSKMRVKEITLLRYSKGAVSVVLSKLLHDIILFVG